MRDQGNAMATVSSIPASDWHERFCGVPFQASAPVAIILSAGAKGGLTQLAISSWISCAAFAINGVLTIAMPVIYRQPLAFFWTIPGTVLVASALQHLPFAEVIEHILHHGRADPCLGNDRNRQGRHGPHPHANRHGHGRRRLPELRAGLDTVVCSRSVARGRNDRHVFCALGLSCCREAGPAGSIGVLIAGLCALIVSGRTPTMEGMTLATAFAKPQLYAAAFSWPAAFELVIPLTITVVAV